MKKAVECDKYPAVNFPPMLKMPFIKKDALDQMDKCCCEECKRKRRKASCQNQKSSMLKFKLVNTLTNVITIMTIIILSSFIFWITFLRLLVKLTLKIKNSNNRCLQKSAIAFLVLVTLSVLLDSIKHMQLSKTKEKTESQPSVWVSRANQLKLSSKNYSLASIKGKKSLNIWKKWKPQKKSSFHKYYIYLLQLKQRIMRRSRKSKGLNSYFVILQKKRSKSFSSKIRSTISNIRYKISRLWEGKKTKRSKIKCRRSKKSWY